MIKKKLSSIIVPNREKALYLAKRQLVELVTDAVNLEGINLSFPEVQTLLDGITVGGRRITDITITLNQAKAWEFLFDALEEKNFSISKSFSCQLHAVAARKEALTWGEFRNGSVSIAGTEHCPPDAKQLDACWSKLLKQLETIDDVYQKATTLFLQMARQQFFFEVNKRMGRFMMNGYLLSKGYPIINVPAKRQLEFNQLMLAFYDSNDQQRCKTFYYRAFPIK